MPPNPPETSSEQALKGELEMQQSDFVQNAEIAKEQPKEVSQNRNISIPTETVNQKPPKSPEGGLKERPKEVAQSVNWQKPAEQSKSTEQPKLVQQQQVEKSKQTEPKQDDTQKIISEKYAQIPLSGGEGALYAFQANAPHYVAFYIPRGGRFDFEQVKKALDEYNAANYATMNLKVTLEEFGRESIIFVSIFADANVAKSYFLRMLKEPTIVKATSGMNKRNLITTRDNLNKMLQNNALDVYFEFMREYYLK